MIQEGQVVLFTFPQTDQATGKLRPSLVLVIRSLPGHHDDWLVCMISTQISQELPEIDEVIRDEDPDFAQTGLKTTSLLRVSRLAVVSTNILQGSIGSISESRLDGIRARLADWIDSSTEHVKEKGPEQASQGEK